MLYDLELHTDFDESETGADGSLVKKQKQFKPSVFFPNFKEKLSVAQDEVKSKMQKLREEQEKLRLQEEENKKKEFRSKMLNRFCVDVQCYFLIVIDVICVKNKSFLNMAFLFFLKFFKQCYG